jgi:hypothetical protein
VTIAFVAGHSLNYALMLAANHLLDSGGFGLFYTALLIINVVLSPIIAVMLVLSRQFADTGARHGRPHVVVMTCRILRGSVRALPAVAAVSVLLASVAAWFGYEAWPIALLIPLTVLAVVVTEILRTSFQGMLLFGWQNAVWIVTIAAQFAFATGAMWLLPRVWVGLAGVLAGAAFASAVFIPWFIRASRASAPETVIAIAFDFRRELPILVSYSLFILLNNIDILVGYWLLPRAALDAYAASSLLPKAITTATFAVAQVVLPVVVEQITDGISCRQSVIKAVTMVTGLGGAATAVLWIAVPWLQATPFGIHGLDFTTMMTLAIAAVALGAIRVLVVVEIALRRYAVGLAQAGAIAVFAVWSILTAAPALRIAELYAVVSCGFMLIVACVLIASRPVLSGVFQSPAR